MTRAEVGFTVTHRRYVPYSHAHYAGNLVDGAYSLAAFGDVATELCIRTDGDEGLFASYSDVQFRAPVRAGDVIEIEARLVRVGTRSPRDGVRGARRRPGHPGARRVRRRGPRPPVVATTARGVVVVPAGRVTYRWRVPTPLRYAVRPAAAVVAGLCLWLAFPGPDLWWLAPVGVALLAGGDPDRRRPPRGPARPGRRPRLLRPVLSWSGVYVGALPVVRPGHPRGALRRGDVGASSGTAGRGSPPRGAPARAYLLVPLGWVVQEWARGATPLRRVPVGPAGVQPGRQPAGPRRPLARARRA